ncbi:MAG: hypothetical protein JWP91_1217 [Fibrobacteres bacterium]|nr:hypothetical protein [Fibrobacterota bacterium]
MPKSRIRLSPAALSLAAAVLWSCAAPNPYRPFGNGIGYSEVAIAPGRFEIMFQGPQDQDELTAKKYAMVRAAEIAKRENFPYFRIDRAKTREKGERETVRETTYSDPMNGYPGRPWRRRYRSRAVTRTEWRPVAKITVTLDSTACGDCLSTDSSLAEAARTGILGR